MAATTSKLSPSNRPIDGNDDVDPKDNGTVDAGGANISTTEVEKVESFESPLQAIEAGAATVVSTPTYLSVESSDVFRLAKQHLSDGNFEEALTVIEEGIRDTKTLLTKLAGNDNEDDFAMHESIAPLHYLYGSTLLYSIEETDQEVTTAGSAVSTAVVSGGDVASAAATMPTEVEADEESANDDEGENNKLTAADAIDDMEIAWENLEAARSIIEHMPSTEKLELDLAQVYLREGDLQRMNGRNENAVHDYQSCLRLRLKSQFIDKNDRKIADVHYNLGLVYINVASKDDETPDAEAPKAPADDKVKEAKRIHARNKSVYHFLECSKCFCGQIANLCHADAKALLVNLTEESQNEDVRGKKGNFKSTGEEDDETELPDIASAKLRTLRKRVGDLVNATTELTTEQRTTIDELCELLDDIQETIDAAEESTKSVQEVTNMKAEVSAMAAAEDEVGDSTVATGEGITTIGFASSVMPPASENVAYPMMMIKKKKRAAVEQVQTADNKKPKPQSE
jgi:tetratricopeptide (TPR) repeat protein